MVFGKSRGPRNDKKMIMTQRSEMAVPNSFFEFICGIISCIILFTPILLGTVVALLNIAFQVQFILPCIWLAIMASGIMLVLHQEGGFRRLLINTLGFFSFKQQFVESVVQNNSSVEIRFGYQLFGRRLYYFTVPLSKIQEVEWSPMQNPHYWDVFVWYDHDDPEKSLENQMSRKPDQDIYCIGLSFRKKKAEAFGLKFVDFLLQNGAKLARQNDYTFVRTIEDQNIGQ